MKPRIRIVSHGEAGGELRVVGPFEHQNAQHALIDAWQIVCDFGLEARAIKSSGVVRVPRSGPPRVEYTLRLE